MDALRAYVDKFDVLFTESMGPPHPLSADLPLMKPHIPMLFAVGYLLFAVAAPEILRSINVFFKLKPIMRLYNLFMVLLSFYMGTKSTLLAREANNTVFCVPLAQGAAGREMAVLVWIFTYSKVVEFLDTVFMILEGRLHQRSFLHVYHHVTILSYWFAILWMSPGSDAYFSLAGNSYIHVLMYGYYFLSSIGYQPWWKYYITKAQIFQFCCFCVQSIYVGYIKPPAECDFPSILARGLLWYMLTLIALFLNFLMTSKSKSKKGAAKEGKKIQ